MSELTRLSMLVALADERHFGRAAGRLGITQPSLSQQIARLESDLGVTLVDRSVRPVQLTPAGAQLVGDIAPALRSVDDAVRAIRVASEDRTICLAVPRIQMLRHPPIRMLTERLREALPGWQIDVLPMLGAEAVSKLRDGTVDAAVIYTPVYGDGIVARPLFMDTPDVLMHRDHPLATGDHVTLTQLGHEPILTWESDSHPGLVDALTLAFRRLDVSPTIVEVDAKPGSLAAALEAQRGVAIIAHAWSRSAVLPSLVARPLREPAIALSAVLAHVDTIRPAVARALDHALEDAKTTD